MTRIAIDATVVSRRLKGAGRVVKNLVLALPRVDDSEHIALAFPEGAEILREAGVQHVMEVPDARGLLWELRGLGEAATKVGADAVLTLREIVGFGGPPALLHLAEPPAYRLRSGWRGRPVKYVAKDRLLQSMLGGSVRRATLVTAASVSTADWLQGRYGIDAPVIPPGIDPVFLQDAESSSNVRPYFLHPATGDHRDNSTLVLRAFALLPPNTARLVLLGTPERERGRLVPLARSLDIETNLDFVGWVSDERLRDLYHGAIALVHPSSYEGFAGLQPLESLAQGTPVIALRAPGVTEALDGVAELVSRPEPHQLAEAMLRLASDADHRANLGRNGRQRARELTWERAAASFARLLRELA